MSSPIGPSSEHTVGYGTGADPATGTEPVSATAGWSKLLRVLGRDVPAAVTVTRAASRKIGRVLQVADSYEILSTVPDVELVPPNKTKPVRVVTARAIPSYVVFWFVVTKPDFVASHVALIAHDIAEFLNADAAVPGVEAIEFTEAINASLQRYPLVQVTVSSTSGDLTDDVDIPYQTVTIPATFAKRIATERAKLDAIAEL